jgi:hypothetical protein
MAYTLPGWRDWRTPIWENPWTPTPEPYPEPTGHITPTDQKRWLTQYATQLDGWDGTWTHFLPAISGFLEGKISDPRDYMPAGMWDDVLAWYSNVGGASGEGTIEDWAESNPLADLPGDGSYYWMSGDWWMPGKGDVNTYTPPPTPDPGPSQKEYIVQDMLQQGVMGRTDPGNSNFGVAPAQLEPIQAFEQPMQQFSTLNQWNTMPKWDMGAGPDWVGI